MPTRKAFPTWVIRETLLRDYLRATGDYPSSWEIAEIKRLLALHFVATGMPCEVLELDHDPALGMRAVDLGTDEWTPHQHHPAYLTWRPRAEHKVKTRADVRIIAKVRRNASRTNRTRDLLQLAEQAPVTARPRPKRAWPKRPFRDKRQPTGGLHET